MAHTIEEFSGRLKLPRAASTASGGTALSTTAALISLPLGSDWVSVTPRNFVGAVVARFAINPYLTIVKTSDAFVTDANVTDMSVELQDGDTTAIALASFPAAASSGFIYVGAEEPFRGVAVDLTGLNDAATVLTVKYWNGASWVTISATDGTDVAGDSFKQDGNVTWTVPTAWAKTSLLNSVDTTFYKTSWSMPSLYWTRWQFSNALDASPTVIQMRAFNQYTSYAELLEGQTFETSIKTKGPGGVACIEALTDAGTANLVVNVATKHDGGYV